MGVGGGFSCGRAICAQDILEVAGFFGAGACVAVPFTSGAGTVTKAGAGAEAGGCSDLGSGAPQAFGVAFDSAGADEAQALSVAAGAAASVDAEAAGLAAEVPQAGLEVDSLAGV